MKLRVKIENETYEVEVGDLKARPILAQIGEDTFEVWPEEAETAPAAVVAAPKAAPAAAPVAAAAPCETPRSSKAITSPLPGTIIQIKVNAGDSVKAGQELLILEAMKMKNTIRATRAGTIATIHVHAGQTVAHNQPLLDYKD